MNTGFGTVDDVYIAFLADVELMALLGNPLNATTRNEKLRREICPLDDISTQKLNFISFYFSSATETTNIYVNRGFFNVDFYATDRVAARKMTERVSEVLVNQGFFSSSEYNEASGIKGVFKYTIKYRPLIWA